MTIARTFFFSKRQGAVSNFAYKLTFKPFHNIFKDRLSVVAPIETQMTPQRRSRSFGTNILANFLLHFKFGNF
jgi:hypothetical protein